MRKYAKSAISLTLVLMVLFSGLVPALALDDIYTGEVVGLWDQYFYSSLRNNVSFNVDLGLFELDFDNPLAGFDQWLTSGISHMPFVGHGSICSVSDDALHHAKGLVDNQPHYDKDGNLYAIARCSYCGANFNVYGSDFKQLYDDRVSSLPATTYGSDGSIYVIPPLALRYISGSVMRPFLNNGESLIYGKDKYSYALPLFRYEILENSLFSKSSLLLGLCLEYEMPFLGTAELLYSSATYSTIGASGNLSFYNSSESGISNYANGSIIRKTLCPPALVPVKDGDYILAGYFVNFYLNDFRLKLTPYSTESDLGDTYNINSRPTSITGDYGIIGDNGQIIKVEDNSTIINETNNTYYNPVTGTTSPITDWSFDYSDRSYKVTLESGDTSTITYGDENISITETTINESGDTITNNYTIYYIVNGTGTETPPCIHEWTETSTTPATCTVPGSRLSTCTKCGETKTESVPALGHDWQVKQSVTTEYDDTGQLVQEGYTIYECSRCHEQYKSASGASPPTNPADPDASGDGVFSGIFGLLLDFLSFFWKTFRDFTKSGVKAFLEALKDGTSDIFGLLNPFDWSA